MSLTVGSLFSGIGGLDLGLERAGMTVRWQAEVDPYCCRVLAKHWPDVPNLGDVTRIDWSSVERVDVICAGWPCQPFSYAGSRRGSADDRHLWPYVFDAVRVLRPRYLLGENVAGHLSLGFDRVLADLASIGFDADWSVVSACSVGAPHMRRRLFVLAYPDRSGQPDIQRRSTLAECGRFGAVGDPGWWDVEPEMGRVADGVPHRVDRVRALGNAVVPQVAELIGRRIAAVA